MTNIQGCSYPPRKQMFVSAPEYAHQT